MTPERTHQLEHSDSEPLTRDEMLAGWHFCIEFDGLLTQGEERKENGACAFCGFDGSEIEP